ncbi:hypothetical protein [Noviluteimonas gilva]|uniref:Uncharacterized protein n=1 Tax=Noviluteimonas gilva TaxID=2682097 RepID=A0A7C9HPB2_9GAMM|nr:hypothetical protein [Lysobacter gilvus]MUV15710.1 hypothetical protein [Lysobacter gilvus]
MRLSKTDKARDALGAAGKSGAVDLRDRQILILADGKRTRAELIAMLGAERVPSIDRLVREGFLASADSAPVIVPIAPASVVAPMPASVPTAKRRSLAAAKMYLIDMLQLQRTPTSAELRLAIQSTSDPVLLLDRLLEALDYLVTSTTPSYGERVSARFAEVVPEDALSRLPTLAA